MLTRGARTSPTTRAPSSSATLSSPARSPFTAPRTTMRRALTPLPTSAPSAIVTSPSTCPWISRSPEPVTLPRTWAPRPMIVVLSPRAISHVHVDVALELGAVRDGDARGLHVADDLGAGLQVHAIARRDVPRDLPGHAERPADHVGLD